MLQEIKKDGKLLFRLHRIIYIILIIPLGFFLLIDLVLPGSSDGLTIPLSILLLSIFGFYNARKAIKKEERWDRITAHVIFILIMLFIITIIIKF